MVKMKTTIYAEMCVTCSHQKHDYCHLRNIIRFNDDKICKKHNVYAE